MTSERRLLLAAITALLLGVGLMVPFEGVVTRVTGVASLFAFIVLGVFAIASPQRLAEPDPSETAQRQE
jgi:hypothetical protein